MDGWRSPGETPPRPPTNTGWQWSWRGTMPRSDTGTGWCSLPRGLAPAIATAPDCADPYFPLAYLQDQSGFNREAMTNYEAFLKRAPQAMDGQIRAARARLALLRAGSPGPVPQ